MHPLSAHATSNDCCFAGTTVRPTLDLRVDREALNLTFESFPGHDYDIQYRPDLSSGEWSTWAPNIEGTGLHIAVTDAVPAVTRGFYRAAVQSSSADVGAPMWVGGGEGYGAWIAEYDFFVGSKSNLLAALEQASAGDVIYIDDASVIDLSGEMEILIPDGVTIASGRGRDGSLGGILRADRIGPPQDPQPCTPDMERFLSRTLLRCTGPNVRVTGLRFVGPDTTIGPCRDWGPRDIGITISHSSPILSTAIEIDNCEFRGWSHAAVSLRNVTGVRVHHNHFHHNRRTGLGYGVVLNDATALIDFNLFNNNRHDIAGTGRPHTGYEARYNLVMRGATSHSFDMHGGADRGENHDDAGRCISVHHNTFLQSEQPAFKIRGVPTVGAWVHHNEFAHASQSAAVEQINAQGNLYVADNAYGVQRGPQWHVSWSGTHHWQFRKFDPLPVSRILLGNFDGDDRTDAFRAQNDRWDVSWSGRSDWALLRSDPHTIDELALGDFNGDDVTDIIRADDAHPAWYISWSGRTPWEILNRLRVDLQDIAVGDFDGNGVSDLFHADGTNWMASWGGTSSWHTLNTSQLTIDQLGFGDFNADGKTDVFRTSPTRPEWSVSWSGISSWEVIATREIDVAELGFGDFDGDDRTDIFYTDGSTWHVSWGGRSDWETVNRSSLRLPDLVFGDINADGMDDVMTRLD